MISNLLNETIGLKIKEISFETIEKYQGILEYDFYLINLKVITEDEKKQSIFIKSIKQGKIKESLFCKWDLAYEKYYKNNSKKLEKISILETNENKKDIHKVSVKLFGDNLKRVKTDMEIYFIEMSKFLENKNIKERIGNIEINPKDMIIIGVNNESWFIVKNLL